MRRTKEVSRELYPRGKQDTQRDCRKIKMVMGASLHKYQSAVLNAIVWLCYNFNVDRYGVTVRSVYMFLCGRLWARAM